MSDASVADQTPRTLRNSGLKVSTSSIANGALAVAVFLIGFVFFEPAPYELFVVILMVTWFAFGLTLKRGFLPLTFFLICFVCGGFIAATQKPDVFGGFFYITITTFLATTALFYAAIVADRPKERLDLIFKAYLIAAVIGAIIGILAYFQLIPNHETFTFGRRARGPFQDPNVFGPFLVLPIIFLVRKVMLEPLSKSGVSLTLLAILLAAQFLAFSRASWGLTVLSFGLIVFLTYVTTQNGALRRKIVFLTVGLLVGAVALLLFALSFDVVSSLFAERAKLVQSYDGARFGRFARYSIGFGWAMEAPLGYGFGKFRETFGEDTHNIYLKAFLVYGWLGGITYLLMVGTTLVIGFKHLFRNTAWQGYFQCCYILVLGHAMVGLVVDIDRWRHLYLIYGLLWGMIAADRMRRRYRQKTV